MREFGDRIAGAEYVLRPGGYAVVARKGGEIAVVETRRGFFLPGGGCERGESAEAAAVRETLEECGLFIRILGRIGAADEFCFAAEEETYFCKRCTFFRAVTDGVPLAGGEESHVLTWMDPREARERLRHQSQRWAVAEASRGPA